MSTPNWALTVAFWLHMLATVTWVGSLAVLSIIILPVAKNKITEKDYASFLRAVNKKLDPLGWFGLTVLTVTGLIQMSSNSNYEGFLAVNNDWARAILFKHIAFFGIIAISAYQTWTLTPALEREAIKKVKGLDTNQPYLETRRERLIHLNLFLSVIVLLFTALARVA